MFNHQAAREAVQSCDNIEDLNQLIRMVKDRQTQLDQSSRVQLFVGDKVSFASKRGYRVYGIVDKVNRKTIKVRETSSDFSEEKFTQWTVSPSLLEKED